MPVIPDIHVRVYEAAKADGALDMNEWHKDGNYCGSTHCRAGWAVYLAGKEGRKLEKRTSTAFAAMQIFKAAGHPINPTRFFDNETDALADMKRMAELTKGAA